MKQSFSKDSKPDICEGDNVITLGVDPGRGPNSHKPVATLFDQQGIDRDVS